jgi:peptide/nickel transport system substrate-binding protein
MANWGAGWIYSPDYYPTGEELFSTGASSNYGNWSDKKADALVNATTTASASKAQAALNAYENYIAQQVPVVFFPTAAGAFQGSILTALSGKLQGYQSNVFASLLPEQWSIK